VKVSEREFAKRMLVSLGIAIANAEKLMESESEEGTPSPSWPR